MHTLCEGNQFHKFECTQQQAGGSFPYAYQLRVEVATKPKPHSEPA